MGRNFRHDVENMCFGRKRPKKTASARDAASQTLSGALDGDFRRRLAKAYREGDLKKAFWPGHLADCLYCTLKKKRAPGRSFGFLGFGGAAQWR
ncbi:MAG: hypothetical protein LBJ64_11555, partial [Deltaproteobacteria bacterium]|nr:hypothetical protein [Deltaproteobacteria bacterium]